MGKIILRTMTLILAAGLLLGAARVARGGLVSTQGKAPTPGEITPAALDSQAAEESAAAVDETISLAPLPIFRYPVVPGAVISGYFDHNPTWGRVTWYNGMQNSNPNYGFYFSCPQTGMYDFVGCADNVSGEQACPNNREIWYDNHRGIDYEFASNWHTGAVCDPGRFAGITEPIYAPAAGRVQFAGYDPGRPGNGWHIRIKHDLNQDGNYENDGFRSNFLHFTANALAVQTNQVVSEGQYLGLGGSTGYSSSPHLHFEIQKSSDNFSTSVWSVDPYGWAGPGSDPWPYQNRVLWRYSLDYKSYLPYTTYTQPAGCPNCGELLRNGSFEDGDSVWMYSDSSVGVIANDSQTNLPISPYSGSWLGWLGGRDNADDRLYQLFQAPAGLASARLSFYMMVTTAESGGVYDRFYIRLRAENGNLMEQLAALDNTFQPAGQWVRREVDIPALVGQQGKRLMISFEATTDSNTTTNFFIDDISLEAFDP